ncbi:MAG: hypothetical protein RDU30_10270, partial [Desulfovibrionaceae bacterium]|nr:hypothetical protein [Desulfovibrionaceae bacterium]
RLTALIDDVLDLTRLEAGTLDWKTGPVDVLPLVEEAAASFPGLPPPSRGLPHTINMASP